MTIKKQSDAPVNIYLLITVVVVVWLALAIASIFILPKWDQRAQLGEMFGSVSALFSGLAFAVLIYAMWLQKTELALQRQELELTRQELAKTSAAQEATQKAVELQVELMTLSADLSATATLLEAHQRVHATEATYYGVEVERLQRELHKRIQGLRILKPDDKENT